MDIFALVSFVVNLLAGIPSVGPVLVIVFQYLAVIPVLATSVATILHAVVGVLQALSVLPKLEVLKTAADKMKNSQEDYSGFVQGKMLPLLDRLSAIKLPTKP